MLRGNKGLSLIIVFVMLRGIKGLRLIIVFFILRGNRKRCLDCNLILKSYFNFLEE